MFNLKIGKMRTIENDYKRKAYFDSVIDAYINGNIKYHKDLLGKLSKIDIVRLTNYLRFFTYGLYLDINGNKELNLFELKK